MANFDLNNDDDFVRGAKKRAKSNESKPNLVMLNVRVPKRLRDRLKLAAVQNDRTNASIVEEALENWLKKAEEKDKSHISAFEDDGL